MTQDEIIRMAREADVWTEETIFMADVLNEKVERFAALVAAHEREACAKVCEETNPRAYMCAAAIRARGNDATA